MRKLALLVCLIGLVMGMVPAAAQDDLLSVDNIELRSSVDEFGQPIMSAVGVVTNHNDTDAYTDISLNAEVYDASNTLIGEGIGVLTNACGIGLLPNFALQPQTMQHFSAPLELFEQDASVARVVINASARPTAATPTAPLAEGITQVTSAETVNVEWIDDHSLHYATGCETDLFTDWQWQTYNMNTESASEIVPPHADDVTPELRQRLLIEDDLIFAHSMLRYAPGGDRLVYQDGRNDFLTAYVDGTFRRGLYVGLHNQSLQGIYWLPQERFLAYYYGAYGDPVMYFTADAEARVISPALANNPPSQIVPGISRDARRVVVAGDYEDGAGYYLYVVTNGFFEKQFEAPIPGNNYPAPIPVEGGEEALIERIYVATPAEDGAHLQCYNRDEGVLHDLAPLPLQLSDSERASWWLSPDNNTLALAADGVNGGLWLIDLTALPACAND